MARPTGLVGRQRRTPMNESVRLRAHALACAAVAGEWTAPAIAARMVQVIPGGRWSGLARSLAERPKPHEPDLALLQLIADSLALRTAVQFGHPIRTWLTPTPVQRPGPWPVPLLPTEVELAAALGLEPPTLEWFVDLKGLEAHAASAPLRHYHRRWLAKPAGGARLVEAPKGRTRDVQRWVLREILDLVPPHPSALGFRRGLGVRAAALPHVGREVVLSLDLEDFFASVSAARVVAIFAALGYPRAVARCLAGLCTTHVPHAVLRDQPRGGDQAAEWRQRARLRDRHLPTGAPTSPAVANLAAFGLDTRLAALATAAGGTYTRYADDLTFSGDGDFARGLQRFVPFVAEVAVEEGYRLNRAKSCIARRGARQEVLGLVVNERAALRRDQWDRLRAILHNCRVHGPAGQNRAGHPDFRAWLTGSVAAGQAMDPKRGGKLAEMLAAVQWEVGLGDGSGPSAGP